MCDGGTNFWELDINDVTKLSLRMIGNTNSDDIALNLGPLWSHYNKFTSVKKEGHRVR